MKLGNKQTTNKIAKLLAGTLAVGLVLGATSASATGAVLCSMAASASASPKVVFSKAAHWRKDITNTTSDISDLDANSENGFKDMAKEFEREVLEDHVAATMTAEFITAGKVKPLVDQGDYGSGITPRWGISDLKGNSKLRLFLLLTVSGHAGGSEAEMTANALKWATSDTYDIIAVYPGGKEVTLVKAAPSKGVVTVQEVDLDLVKDQVVSVLYVRSGSAGARAYPEGRIFEVVWDGK